MLSVVTWRWGTDYTTAHVNALAKMVRRHYPHPHRFLCVTDSPAGLDAGIEFVPDRRDFADLPSPRGRGWPSCYRRLRLFEPDAAATFGERIVALDLDVVITGDVTPLWDRPEDFVGWRDPVHTRQLNGSMLLLRAGSRPQVWTDFTPGAGPRAALAAGFRGSDQAWLSYCLPGEASWTPADGVLAYRIDCMRGLPEGARIVFFWSQPKPWDKVGRAVPWVRQHWPG